MVQRQIVPAPAPVPGQEPGSAQGPGQEPTARVFGYPLVLQCEYTHPINTSYPLTLSPLHINALYPLTRTFARSTHIISRSYYCHTIILSSNLILIDTSSHSPLFYSPLFVIGESYRSCEHMYRLIAEQSMRYINHHHHQDSEDATGQGLGQGLGLDVLRSVASALVDKTSTLISSLSSSALASASDGGGTNGGSVHDDDMATLSISTWPWNHNNNNNSNNTSNKDNNNAGRANQAALPPPAILPMSLPFTVRMVPSNTPFYVKQSTNITPSNTTTGNTSGNASNTSTSSSNGDKAITTEDRALGYQVHLFDDTPYQLTLLHTL